MLIHTKMLTHLFLLTQIQYIVLKIPEICWVITKFFIGQVKEKDAAADDRFFRVVPLGGGGTRKAKGVDQDAWRGVLWTEIQVVPT